MAGPRVPSFVTRLRNRPVVRTVIDAWQHLSRTNGNLYAGAITFFSFLALFPLILLAVSVAGFVLAAHPAALQTLFEKITINVPGQFGSTLKTAIRTAIDARTGVGVIGLLGVLSTGLGWIGNLRTALDAIWERRPPQQNFIVQRVVNLGVLAALGGAAVVSIVLTAVGTALTSTLVSHLGLSDVPGVGVGTRIVGLLLATAADVLLFLFVLVRLPHTHVSLRVGLVGAVVAAVGFEILKVAGTYTIAASAHSATAGPFAGLIAVLVWVQLVARLVLFCTALTVVRSRVPQAFVPYEPVAGRSEPEGPSAVAVGAGLVGVGAVTGAAVTAYLLRRREGVTVR